MNPTLGIVKWLTSNDTTLRREWLYNGSDPVHPTHIHNTALKNSRLIFFHHLCPHPNRLLKHLTAPSCLLDILVHAQLINRQLNHGDVDLLRDSCTQLLGHTSDSQPRTEDLIPFGDTTESETMSQSSPVCGLQIPLVLTTNTWQAWLCPIWEADEFRVLVISPGECPDLRQRHV